MVLLRKAAAGSPGGTNEQGEEGCSRANMPLIPSSARQYRCTPSNSARTQHHCISQRKQSRVASRADTLQLYAPKKEAMLCASWFVHDRPQRAGAYISAHPLAPTQTTSTVAAASYTSAIPAVGFKHNLSNKWQWCDNNLSSYCNTHTHMAGPCLVRLSSTGEYSQLSVNTHVAHTHTHMLLSPCAACNLHCKEH
jgi:hypothetical protein